MGVQSPNVAMSTTAYTPASGRAEWTGLYDLALPLLTRERRWRVALAHAVAPEAEDTILDVGCGTGTLAVLLARTAPGARIVGLDPDPAILARARAKAAAFAASVTFLPGFARDAASAGFGFDKIVSSLVFHQVPMAEKRAGFAAMFAALKPGGQLHIADYGEQRTAPMRALFRIIQALDGVENTEPNACGMLPQLMRETGFSDVVEYRVIPTPTGSISLYKATRPL